MARTDIDQGLMPSVLDRLIDPESGGTEAMRGYTIEQMFKAVQRDLEDLLNTRQSHAGLHPDYVELRHSVFGFGLPDLLSLNAITPNQRMEIGKHIEEVIQHFEPRLKDVQAFVVTEFDSKERSVRFRVAAKLCVDPSPEVAFDTILQLSTGQYQVTEASPT